MVKNGFAKWLNSTKFQIAVLAIFLIYLAQVLFKLNSETAARLIKDIALGYFGARILEPVVDYAISRWGGFPGYKQKTMFEKEKEEGRGEE